MKNIVFLLFSFLVGCSPSSLEDQRVTQLFKEHNDAKILDLLEKKEINLEYQTRKEQFSLLHLAILYQDSNLLETLIEQGVPLDAVSRKKDTPLVFAIERNEVDFAQILVDDQADPNIPNKQEETPLILAVKKNLSSLVKVLVDGTDDRVDPFLRDKNGKRALEYLKPTSTMFELLSRYEKRWSTKKSSRQET